MKTLVYHLGVDAGFFSEYCNMLYAFLYCKRNGINFKLYSEDANFGKEKGWQDYFMPYFVEVQESIHHTHNYRFSQKVVTTSFRHFLGSLKRMLIYRDISQYIPYYKFLDSSTTRKIKRAYRLDYFTQDIWHDIPHHLVMKDLSMLHDIDNTIWRYNKNTAFCVCELLNMYELRRFIEEGYVAVHIRRGDKVSEAPNSSIIKYMEAIKEKTNCRNIFVATDDYAVYVELCKSYPDYQFFTLTQNTKNGYQQTDFNSAMPNVRYKETIALFADVEMMSKADLFVGTFTSNVGQYMLIRRNGKKCCMIDYDL